MKTTENRNVTTIVQLDSFALECRARIDQLNAQRIRIRARELSEENVAELAAVDAQLADAVAALEATTARRAETALKNARANDARLKAEADQLEVAVGEASKRLENAKAAHDDAFAEYLKYAQELSAKQLEIGQNTALLRRLGEAPPRDEVAPNAPTMMSNDVFEADSKGRLTDASLKFALDFVYYDPNSRTKYFNLEVAFASGPIAAKAWTALLRHVQAVGTARDIKRAIKERRAPGPNALATAP